MELVPHLLSMGGANFFLSDKINQDPLEKHFGHISMCGGGSENPTQEMFGLMNRKIGYKVRPVSNFPWKYSWTDARRS